MRLEEKSVCRCGSRSLQQQMKKYSPLNSRVKEKIVEKALFISASVSILAIGTITIYVFYSGLPLIIELGIRDFIFNTEWRPMQNIFGIYPTIIGSVMVTAGALALAVPLGLGGAIFLAEFAPQKIALLLRPSIQLLAGIPSVVFGFWGLITLVPLLRSILGGSGFSALTASIILAIMILPTIISISEDTIRSIPRYYKEGSLSLGSTHWQAVKHILLPASRQGIITAVVLGMGRAMGETMAIIMVAGNVPAMPGSFLDPVRTLTGNIVMEIGYAQGDHQRALFATGAVLFVFIMILTIFVNIHFFGKVKSGEA